MTYIQRRGLEQLYDAGITAILDHHALPGVQDPGQQFTGRLVLFILADKLFTALQSCTQDVEFYVSFLRLASSTQPIL